MNQITFATATYRTLGAIAAAAGLTVAELATLSQVAEELGKKAKVALRFNPDVDAKTHPYISTGLKKGKFGMNRAEIADLDRASAIVVLDQDLRDEVPVLFLRVRRAILELGVFTSTHRATSAVCRSSCRRSDLMA